ncbi:MAG TPA: sugar transferase, partial [Candidatus Saccharimonadaceae bacterium]|nr:sugar transferase [Candidatus Saccharimonadaceae bacterium]
MPTRNTKFFSFILLIADAVVLLAAFSVAYFIRVKLDNRPLLNQAIGFDYLDSVLLILPFWIVIFAFIGLYRSSIYSRRLIEWSRILVGCFIGVLFMISWQYVTESDLFPARLIAVYILIASFVLIVFEREILKALRKLAFRFGRGGVSRVLLIGNSAAVSDIALTLGDTAKSGYKIRAIASPTRLVPDSLGPHLHHFTSVDQALAAVKELGITTIIQTDLYDSEAHNQRILTTAQINHIQYNFIPGEPEFYTGKNTVDVFLGYPMITVSPTPLVGWGAILKRIFDQIISTLLLIILSPIFLILIVLQLIFDPGPIFYISKRLSQFSKPINLIKFRTMRDRPTAHLDAAEEFR